MSTNSESYNGWTNRETWAVALHINNDQGWRESVLEQLAGALESERMDHHRDLPAWKAGEIIRENVEEALDGLRNGYGDSWDEAFNILTDIGSLWRVNWDELGAAFLEDLEG